MKLPRLFLPVLFLATTAFVNAEMVFEDKLVEVAIKSDQETVDVVFPFEIKNGATTIVDYSAGTSLETLTIKPLNSDGSAKLKWQEGESGQIMSRMNTSYFRGTVEKSFKLNLKDQKEAVVLMVRIHAPELIKMEPSSLKWDKGGEAGEKVMKITMNHDKPIRILKDVGKNNKVFPYTLKTIREGWEYEIRITPSDTSESGIGMISLTTDCEFSRFKRAAAYAVIRPVPKTEK